MHVRWDKHRIGGFRILLRIAEVIVVTFDSQQLLYVEAVSGEDPAGVGRPTRDPCLRRFFREETTSLYGYFLSNLLRPCGETQQQKNAHTHCESFHFVLAPLQSVIGH